MLADKSDGTPPNQLLIDIDIAKQADNFARDFNALQGDKRQLQFVIPQLLRVESASMFSDFYVGEYITVEDKFPGAFEKFLSNNGLVTSMNVSKKGSLSAFCHYT